MQSEFYIYRNGKQEGPFSKEKVIEKIKAQDLSASDFVYLDEKSDWVLVMDYEPLTEYIKTAKPKTVPPKKPTKESATASQEWYILKGENRYGPFTYPDLIKMLQEKALFEYEYVWKTGMESWVRVAEVEDFTADKIRGLKDEAKSNLSEVFFRRRHARAHYGASILVHDNKHVWKGQGLEISPGGAGLIMDNSMILPGQVLFLHFKPGEGVPPFNAVCEVVSKRFLKGVRHKDQAIQYGVKFTSIGENARGTIEDYAEKGSAA